MAIHSPRWHSRFRFPADWLSCLPTGACRRMTTITRSSALSPPASNSWLGFASWPYSGTNGRPHRKLADVYALLEERLPVAPLCPNDALDTLLCLLPTDIHHSGVVDHLVRIVSGNACCIDPSLCLAVMERVLVPAIPLWLRGSTRLTESSIDDEELQAAEISDAAVLMALQPLGRVLCRCVVVHVRLLLGGSGGATDSLWRLHGWHKVHTGFLCRRSPHNNSDDSGSSFFLRGAAVLMSFTAQPHHWECDDSGRSAAMSSYIKQQFAQLESSDRWHACSLIAVTYPVVQHLYSAESQTHEREPPAAQTGIPASFSTAGTLPLSRSNGGEAVGDRCAFNPSRWGTVRSLGQQCWWWSTVVCRAIPVIPSAAVRAFAVHSLIYVVHELHRTLAPCVVPCCGSPFVCACSEHHSQLPSSETLRACLDMLEWLLVDSVPVLRGRSETDASWLSPTTSQGGLQSSRPSVWTAELLRGWCHLGGDFADLFAAALECMRNASCTASEACCCRAAGGSTPAERTCSASLSALPPLWPSPTSAYACSHLVRGMANVGYRLALQWAAVVPPLTTAVAMSALVEGTLDAQVRCHTFQQLSLPDTHPQQEQREAPPVCELQVVLRLLHAVTSVRPALSSEASDISAAWSTAAEPVLVEETTWCKLACLVNLVRCCPTDRLGRGDGCAGSAAARWEHQKFVQLHEQRLLHCGMMHVLALAAISTADIASEGVVGAIMTENVAASGHADANPRSPAHTPRHALSAPSAEFLCALLKYWRTWTMDWSLELHAAWLQELESAAAVVVTSAGAGARGVDKSESSSGTSPATEAMTANVNAAIMAPNFPFQGANDNQCSQSSQSIHRRLCSLLTEAWAVTTDIRHDRDPLDMCACWYAFSGVSSPPRCTSATEVPLTAGVGTPPTTCCTSSQLSQQRSCVHQSLRVGMLSDQVAVMTAESEDQFRCMCETWFKRLRDLPNTRFMSSILQLREQRPMLLHRRFVQQQNCHMPTAGWCTISLPAIISHLALRVLYGSRPNCTATTIHDSSGVSSARPRVSDSFIAMIHAAILSPATEELAAFLLTVVSRYVEWCQSAGVHIGWCTCAVQAHSRTGGLDISHASRMPADDLIGPASDAAGMPWWVLTLDGMAVRESVKGRVSVAAILFLWEHGVAAVAAAGVEAPHFFRPHSDHDSSRASAIRPLMPPWLGTARASALAKLSEASPSEELGALDEPLKASTELNEAVGDCHGFSDEPHNMRQSIVKWCHRYALRLILFEVTEGQWHRERAAVLAHQSEQQLARQALCDLRRQRRRTFGAVHDEFVEGDANSEADARLVNYATSAYRSVVWGKGITPRYMWHSDAYQPLLQLIAQSAVRMVDKLTAEVLAVACTTVVQGEASNSKVKAGKPRAAGRLPSGAIVTNLAKAKHPDQWTARLTAHLWSELRRSPTQVTVAQPSRLLPYAAHTSLHGSRHCPSLMQAVHCSLGQQPQSRGLSSSDPVARLEKMLCDLGLVAASEKQFACHAPGGVVSMGGVAEESHALLASLLLSPELVCTSSILVYFASAVLWQDCWASFTKASSAVPHHKGGDMSGSLEGPEDMSAQLDTLVAFRVILRGIEQLQRLVHELVEYLCCIFVPAMQADPCASCLTTAPVEAVCRLACTGLSCTSRNISSPTRHSEHTASTALNRCDMRNPHKHSRFSSAAVRTFEVLCLGRCGDERRAPRVWQEWTRELLRNDPVLRKPPFPRSMSQ
ncbi:hypothetical protein, conserved [Leishmania tarentolae]|uniref:Uncharacterized protein n=1 Tax=Leishmania tarentolae TaxID=5689 RepID=A0A640KIA0_LEITA|nr:hypothetical protein, conserved [Leishmania tarentolae]